LSSPPVVCRRTLVLFMFFCVCLVCLHLQLFVGGRLSYLCFLCLFALVVSNTHFHVFFVCLVYPVLPVSLDCPFWLPLRYSLTFIDHSMYSNIFYFSSKTMDVGSVAALRMVKPAIAVARAVMDYTQHTLLVGDQGR
jgi:hypothetical protein